MDFADRLKDLRNMKGLSQLCSCDVPGNTHDQEQRKRKWYDRNHIHT